MKPTELSFRPHRAKVRWPSMEELRLIREALRAHSMGRRNGVPSTRNVEFSRCNRGSKLSLDSVPFLYPPKSVWIVVLNITTTARAFVTATNYALNAGVHLTPWTILPNSRHFSFLAALAA